MRISVSASVLAASLFVSTLANAAGVLDGPASLPSNISGWPNAGIRFQAKVTSVLSTVRVLNQGAADTITLTDVTAAKTVKSVSLPAGNPTYIATIDAGIIATHEYRVTIAGGANGKYALYSSFPQVGTDIDILSTWGNDAAQTSFWFTFNQFTTVTCDADGDGHNRVDCGGDDCNDKDALVYTGATEQCNNRDDNCNGVVDEMGDNDCVATVPSRSKCLISAFDGGLPDAGPLDAATDAPVDATGDAASSDAGDAGGPLRPYCVECTNSTQCTGTKKTCSPSFACVECLAEDTAACASSTKGKACLANGLCGCTSATDCAQAGGYCVSGECRQAVDEGGVGSSGGSSSGTSSGGSSSGSTTRSDGGSSGDNAASGDSGGCNTAGGLGSSLGILVGAGLIAGLRRRRNDKKANG